MIQMDLINPNVGVNNTTLYTPCQLRQSLVLFVGFSTESAENMRKTAARKALGREGNEKRYAGLIYVIISIFGRQGIRPGPLSECS